MKTSLSITCLIIFLCTLSSDLYTNNVRIVNYPLQLGDVFVFTRVKFISPFPGPVTRDSIFMSCRVSKDTLMNSKRYYYLDSLPIALNAWFRFDSLSGKLFKYDTSAHCNYNYHERLLDSLWADLHDTVKYCGYPMDQCIDTSGIQIFGLPKNSLGFYWYLGGGNYYSKTTVYYTNDFGMTYYYHESGGGGNYGFTRYKLVGCLIGGILYGDTNVYPTAIQQISSDVPFNFWLSQNYPNPFNPSTLIQFAIPKSSLVKLVVYDVLGREVETLVSEKLSPGTYKYEWNAVKYASGIYYYVLETNDFRETKKMALVK